MAKNVLPNMKETHLPPVWCSAICRNALSEICIENCAVKRDASGFKPRPDLKLEDMPRFPLVEASTMTREEKFASVSVYLAKVVDYLQGINIEEVVYPPFHRQDVPQVSGVKPVAGIKVEELFPTVAISDPVPDSSAGESKK